MLKQNRNIITERDACGATVIHTAYLLHRYEIGRWLVEKYPKVALLGYSEDENSVPIGHNDGVNHMLPPKRTCWTPWGKNRSNAVAPLDSSVDFVVPHEWMPYVGKCSYVRIQF